MLLEKKRKGFRREREGEKKKKKKNTNNTKALEKKYYTQRDYKRRCSPQEKKVTPRYFQKCLLRYK